MAEQDHFGRLGLPRRFETDLAALEANYLSRSRLAHPDYHQNGSEADKADSLRDSSLLNDAYRTLKDPFKRAEYLLSLLGGPAASEVKEMPQAFLKETLELRMRLEELKDENDEAGLRKMQSELSKRQTVILGQVAVEFQSADSPEALKSIRQKLNALKFIQGLLRDLRDI